MYHGSAVQEKEEQEVRTEELLQGQELLEASRNQHNGDHS